jgi:hypothetical protein
VAIDGRLKRSQEQPSECSLIRTDTSDGRRLAGLEEELQHAEHNHVLRVHGEKYTKTTREGNTQRTPEQILETFTLVLILLEANLNGADLPFGRTANDIAS